MSSNSKIEWTDSTWNFFGGCRKVSEGCRHCYAIKDAHRLAGNPNTKISGKYRGTTTPAGDNWTGRITFDKSVLFKAFQWTQGRRIFVNSMSDLFYEGVKDEWLDLAFTVMALNPQHTYQILTKRPERMRYYLEGLVMRGYESLVNTYFDEVADFIFRTGRGGERGNLRSSVRRGGWDYAFERDEYDNHSYRLFYRGPQILPNVHLGVSVEDHAAACRRIPQLWETPSAVRWLSCEPLLGPVDITNWQLGLDWVVAGGESGRDARPCHPDWARSLRDQCQTWGIPFFFKQWGSYQPVTPLYDERDDAAENGRGDLISMDSSGYIWEQYQPNDPQTWLFEKIGKKSAGRLLDGRTWDEMPEDVHA